MNCISLLEKIEQNQLKIEKILDVQTFVLNKEVVSLRKEIDTLMTDFNKKEYHEDDGTGKCKYCGKILTK